MKYIFALTLFLSGIQLFAQTEHIDSLLSDLFFNDNKPIAIPQKTTKYNFIYAGSNINNNTFYAGREVGINICNISSYALYYSYTGIYAGLSGIWYEQLAPGYSSTRLTIGYNKAIDKKKTFTARTSYIRSFYYKPDTSYSYPYKNSFNLGLSYRKKWLRARIYSNMLFGEEFKYNLSSAIYARLTIYRFNKYNKLYTTPELSTFFGKEIVSTIDIQNIDANLTPGWQEAYGLLNTQLYLPLGITLSNFDIELSCSVNFPTTQDVNFSYPIKSYYSLTIGYLLPIARNIRPIFSN